MTGHSNTGLTGTTKLDRIGKLAQTHPYTVFNNLGHAITEELLHVAVNSWNKGRLLALIKWIKQRMEKRSPKASTY